MNLMKLLKYLSIAILITSLLGCGHGYEGEFETRVGSSNEFVNAFAGMAGSQKIIIGKDYIETRGERTKFDKIFVRKSGDEKYLVFKGKSNDKNSEEAWRIIDKDTLIRDDEVFQIKFVRVK